MSIGAQIFPTITAARNSAVAVAANTLIKGSKGFCTTLIVTTAGAAGALYDSASIAGIGAGNKIFTVPATAGIYTVNFPFQNGLVYEPGAAQVASISFL
jgi:hypothetical protein